MPLDWSQDEVIVVAWNLTPYLEETPGLTSPRTARPAGGEHPAAEMLGHSLES